MSVPLVFQPKAMSITLLLIAIAFVFVAVLFVSFDSIKFSSSTHHELPINNETLTSGNHQFVQHRYHELIPIPDGAVGPESLAFDVEGNGPYTGVSDGRIIRWQANESRWLDFAVTTPQRYGCEGGRHGHCLMEHICGRPLGLRFNKDTGQLYIADAYMGLLVVGPNGGLATPLAKQVDGIEFGFTNSLDIDQSNGLVYFTDSSTRYSRRNHVSIIMSGDDSGRLLRFNPKTNETTTLVNHLMFPNGVALSKNGDFLLFVETTTCRLFKFWLKTPKAGILEIMAQFPGFPDNIKRNRNGEFWVGINSRRSKALKWLVSNSWIGNALLKFIPLDYTKLHLGLARLSGINLGMGIKLGVDGNVMEVLDHSRGKRWKEVSEVAEENGSLWIGSVTRAFVIKEKIEQSLN